MTLPFPGLFILLGDLVVEREDDPPKIQDYHVGRVVAMVIMGSCTK
jgi:hypothetical protein